MKMFKVFHRIPHPDGDDGVSPWMERMDQLIMSDPRELMSFICDGLIAVAAQMQDPEGAWEEALRIIVESTDESGRDEVIAMVRRRHDQLVAVATERVDATTTEVMRSFWKAARNAPWPDDA